MYTNRSKTCQKPKKILNELHEMNLGSASNMITAHRTYSWALCIICVYFNKNKDQ